MSVTLIGTEGYFTRQGAFIGEFNRIAALYGTGATDGFQAIWNQFVSTDQISVENLPSALEAFRNSAITYQNVLVADAQTQIVTQVNRDMTVTPLTVPQAITVLVAQMRAAAQSINRPTLTSTVTEGSSNLGDAVVAVSTINRFGDPLDMIFAETVTVTCTTDPGTSYAASLQANGEEAQATNSYLWPAGSGASFGFSVTDGASDTLITDGAFENWTGNTPDDWAIENGSAGVNITQGIGGVRSGTSFTAVITSSGLATQLSQAVSLSVNTVYAVSFWAKRNTSDGTGVFRIALVNGDTGAVILDDAGGSLSYTRNLTAQVTGTFACFTAFFATPRQLPANVELWVGYSTAPANGVFLTLDLGALVAAGQLYAGGPYIAAFAGADRTALNDSWSVAFTNSLGSNSFARGSDRLLSMRDNDVYYPSSTSPTISDALVLH